ncbi:MAG: PEP-CTERM sorting domain-containing protein [Fimbriimonadaceae bacterium]
MLVFAAVAVLAGADAQLLFRNGPLVTHPGQGAGGADVSMASAVPNTGGSNVTAVVWRADDFTVDGPGWIVNRIDTYAYDTNFANPRFANAQIQIRGGSAEGEVVASADATWTYSGINRIFNGVANLASTARQVQRVTGTFADIVLHPGLYFMVFKVENTASTPTAVVNNWVPYVMDINPSDPNDPITRVGNSLTSTNSGATFAPTVVSTGGWNQDPELPFRVDGQPVPEPATMVALGVGLAAVAARRAG